MSIIVDRTQLMTYLDKEHCQQLESGIVADWGINQVDQGAGIGR